MSLVNLAHVCSHLQNASRARLGVTSIPVSKLHARLMIELQKQGFLSSVVLGGPSPPLPYKLRAIPEYEVEETSREYIQSNPWAAFPVPDQRNVRGLQKFAKANGRDWTTTNEPEGSVDVMAELQKETSKEDIPEDYYEEEDLSEELEALAEQQPAVFASGKKIQQTIQEFAKSLSQIKTEVSALNRPQPEPLKPLVKPKRQPFSINHNVLPEDQVPANPAQRRLWLGLKYWNSDPVLSKMSLVSKPTKRIWLNHRDLGLIVRGRTTKQVKGMLSPGECVFVTTDRGILEARECVERRIGGTVLCRAS